MYETTWRKEIELCMAANGDSFENICGTNLSNYSLDRVFSKAGENALPLRLWTHDWVYFSKREGGFIVVDSVGRNPLDESSISHL